MDDFDEALNTERASFTLYLALDAFYRLNLVGLGAEEQAQRIYRLLKDRGLVLTDQRRLRRTEREALVSEITNILEAWVERDTIWKLQAMIALGSE